uniref:Uncharacterized protein n=1 Tax=Plectus sambesii TaxID=2011161 RepID=A0A914VIA4_9BILA
MKRPSSPIPSHRNAPKTQPHLGMPSLAAQLPPSDQVAIQMIITSRDLSRLDPLQQQNDVQAITDSLPGLTKAIVQRPPQKINQHVSYRSCWLDPTYLLFIVSIFLSVELMEDFVEALLQHYLPTNIQPILRIIVSANDAHQMAMGVGNVIAFFHAFQGALQVSGTIERQLQFQRALAKICLLQFTLPDDYELAWHQPASFLGALTCLTFLPN